MRQPYGLGKPALGRVPAGPPRKSPHSLILNSPRMMRAMTEIKAVLFDYGMVLSGPAHPPVWAHMQALTGLSPEGFHSAYWVPRRDYDRGDLTGRDYWQTVSPNSSPDTIDLLIEADTNLWTQPNPPMLA